MLVLAIAVYGVFGLASIVGGAIGFKKAGSRASLIAGSLAGGALLAAAACGVAGAANWCLGIGGITSLALAGRFIPAFIKTKKMMPQGMMSAFSALGLIATAAGFWG